jgi:nucleotide-binding universal stress UspA family protein
VSDVLARFCRERGCEAVVMGAFGHSRLREAILGGTTRGMLASVPLPLLLAH